MSRRPIVYDVGLNNGDDSAYYLKKGFDVIGIDAHAGLCELCTRRFETEINNGRMTVLNIGIGATEERRTFFQNLTEDPISTFFPENWGKSQKWTPAQVEVRRLSSIIHEHGDPYFVKVDIEYFDHLALLDLLKEQILPPFISAEAQTIDVYCALVCMGYESFKVINGIDVATEFRDCELRSVDGKAFRHEFSNVSSGPFADDLPGKWLDKDEALEKLLQFGLGWVDLHAMR